MTAVPDVLLWLVLAGMLGVTALFVRVCSELRHHRAEARRLRQDNARLRQVPRLED